jgi:hypothetical protein
MGHVCFKILGPAYFSQNQVTTSTLKINITLKRIITKERG